MRLAVIFERFGPYHHARLTALGNLCELTGIEVTLDDSTYAWENIEGSKGFNKKTLFPTGDGSRVTRRKTQKAIKDALSEARPSAVAIPGWAERGALAALQWCVEAQVPAVLMSDSAEEDCPRRPWQEWVKARLVSLFDAALVAGGRHRRYVQKLGMPNSKIFEGYDAIDNDYFEQTVHALRSERTIGHRGADGQRPYFLASARFVEKKNLSRLIDAYVQYRRRAGEVAWGLVALGDGELRERIEAQIQRQGLQGDILLPGFVQYGGLPKFYAGAGAFVHASTTEQWGLVVNEAMASGLPVIVSKRCGCAPELVREGVNGAIFDPFNVQQLASLMFHTAHGPIDLDAMGAASRVIIADWGLAQFCASMLAAVDAALSSERRNAGVADRLLLRALLAR